MNGELSCIQCLCQSNTNSRRLCCRGHPVCSVRNRETETGKGQNIPQAGYLVFRGTNTWSHFTQLASTSIFTQLLISLLTSKKLCSHWMQKVCRTSVVICWSRTCPHCQVHKQMEDRIQHKIQPLLLACMCCHCLIRCTLGSKWAHFLQNWNLKLNKQVVGFFSSMMCLNSFRSSAHQTSLWHRLCLCHCVGTASVKNCMTEDKHFRSWGWLVWEIWRLDVKNKNYSSTELWNADDF